MAKTKTPKPAKTKAPKSKSAAPLASAGPVHIGIAASDREEIAKGLSGFLADAFTLYLKTHNFHWNVTGSMFNSLHAMFMDQYTEQWNALDEIAERIRALGYNAPGSYQEFIKLSSIQDVQGKEDGPAWKSMVSQLVAGNEAVCRTARSVLKIADEAGDDPSVDLLTQRLQIHEKYAWMLRSLLEE